MENNTNSDSISISKLCTNCCYFYANPQFGLFCSNCYKKINPEPKTIINRKPSEHETFVDDSVECSEIMIKQFNKEICWNCSKKTGLNGYTCRCEFTFCKKHRLPEAHNCEFDFISEGRGLLTKANPFIQNDKIERI